MMTIKPGEGELGGGGAKGRGTKWNSEPKWEGGRKLVGKKVLIFWREKYILRVSGGIQLILV